MSEALDFLRAIYRDPEHPNLYIRSGSWRKLNAWLQKGLALAIDCGMVFDIEDFRKLRTDFNGSYWLGSCEEGWYTQAIQQGNSSFVASYEDCYSRKPFMLDGLRVARDRIFDWDGERVACTSFAEDQKSFVACSYEPSLYRHGDWREWVQPNQKIKRRFTITLDQLKAYNKARKEARKEETK